MFNAVVFNNSHVFHSQFQGNPKLLVKYTSNTTKIGESWMPLQVQQSPQNLRNKFLFRVWGAGMWVWNKTNRNKEIYWHIKHRSSKSKLKMKAILVPNCYYVEWVEPEFQFFLLNMLKWNKIHVSRCILKKTSRKYIQNMFAYVSPYVCVCVYINVSIGAELSIQHWLVCLCLHSNASSSASFSSSIVSFHFDMTWKKERREKLMNEVELLNKQ